MVRRGPRPPGSRKLDREVILAVGLVLTKSLPLQDVSIVRVARELDVTPASIHYYLEGRDALTLGIVTLFIHDLLAEWPQPRSSWKPDLEAVATAIYRHYVRYPGIAAYFAAQNRFRVFIPAGEQRGAEHLHRFLERYFAAIAAVGLNARRSAVYSLVLIQFIIAAAHATASHQLPGEQDELGAVMAALDRRSYPNIHRMRASYLGLAGDDAFRAGLHLILAGLQAERRKQSG
ncbi:MAG: TetR/AcrR family transcriptional regulator C-terminal domain-containing protein [Xanthobacteraceae bacterium]|nr:TetR/AcrR family transcriptional regulator C-terminal domain-containing protein [Xanthobacteraceae bacterium]MBV9631035.1 TetR/AcrR family transcriptional regulator C-terminal domain-containing protein [Xanthobacteraceae bacterium]